MPIRMISYNVHKGMYRSWDARGLPKTRTSIPVLSEVLKQLQLDLMFLQEVQGRHDRYAKEFSDWPSQPPHDHLAETLGMKAVYASNAHYLHGHHGNALLSKFQITEHLNHNISDHVLEQRGILHCRIDVAGVYVHCYVVHLGLFSSSRSRQVNALIDIICQTRLPDEPLLIAGDFNDWRGSLSEPLCQALNVQEVYRSDVAMNKKNHFKTFPSLFPCLALDRIYFRGLKLVNAAVLADAVWRSLSDHRPLFAEFDLL
jgi:endonuclease/exonuclease/phosphatase family metal-dependent hydrolase